MGVELSVPKTRPPTARPLGATIADSRRTASLSSLPLTFDNTRRNYIVECRGERCRNPRICYKERLTF